MSERENDQLHKEKKNYLFGIIMTIIVCSRKHPASRGRILQSECFSGNKFSQQQLITLSLSFPYTCKAQRGEALIQSSLFSSNKLCYVFYF